MKWESVHKEASHVHAFEGVFCRTAPVGVMHTATLWRKAFLRGQGSDLQTLLMEQVGAVVEAVGNRSVIGEDKEIKKD